jgi:Cu2+-exporting ATPase
MVKSLLQEVQKCVHCGVIVPAGLMEQNFQYCCKGCETAHHILESLKEESHTEKLDVKKSPPEMLVMLELSPEIKTGFKTENSDCSIAKPVRSRTFEEMDDPVFQRKYVTAINEKQSRVTLILEGMHCASCVNLIEKLPRLLPAVVSAQVNLSRSSGTFIYHHDSVNLAEIARELNGLGYEAHAYQVSSEEVKARQQARSEMIHLAISGVCAGNTMLIAIALYAGVFSGMDAGHLALFRYVSAILGLVTVLIPGQVFFRNAWRALVLRSPHMDLPVAMGIGIGTLDGVYRTITNSGEIYFDSISSLVFLLLVGRFLQSQQKRQTLDRVSLLRALTPQAARRVQGSEKKLVPVEALLVNDIVEIQAGETFPADGMIIEGQALVDQGLLTGESMPVTFKVGDQVISGTTNLSATLQVKVEAVGYDTRLGKLMRMMDEAVGFQGG